MKNNYSTSKMSQMLEKAFLFTPLKWCITLGCTLFILLFNSGLVYAQSTVVNLVSGSSWTVPAGVTSVDVECWGGGGGGGGSSSTSNGGSGGGSGGYVKVVGIAVTPSSTVNYTIGTGGAGGNGFTPTVQAGNGGTTTFGTNIGSPARAGGGCGAFGDRGTSGSGGCSSTSTGACVQTIANCTPSVSVFPNVTTAGNSGTTGNATGGRQGGNAPASGGAGGAARTTCLAGAPGQATATTGGGGGGGGFRTSSSCFTAQNGGNGARGRIRITYTVAPTCPTPNISGFTPAIACVGETVTLSGTAIVGCFPYSATVGGQAVTGLISINEVPVGGPATITFPVPAGATTGAITFTNSAGTWTSSTNITIAGSFTWNGSVSNDWGTAANWTPAKIPCDGANIIIPSGVIPNNPIVSGETPIVGNIDIQTGRVLTIAADGALTTNGVLTNNATLTVQSGGALVQAVGSTNAGSGTYNVQREIPTGPNNAFRFMGSPINNISATGISGVSATGADGGQVTPMSNCSPNFVAANSPYGNILELRENPAAVLFNCAQSLWFVKSTGSLERGRGYGMKVNGGQTITFSGTQVNNGDVPITGLARQVGTIEDHLSTLLSLGPVSRGWHLLSNPYPSPIEIPIGFLSAQGFDDQIQLWNSATGAWEPKISTIGNLTRIAVGQGFQIRRGGDNITGNTAATLTLTNVIRRAFMGVDFFNEPVLGDYRLNVKVNGNNKTDRTTVFFQQGSTPSFDAQFDVNKFVGDVSSPALFTLAYIERMAFNGLPLLTQSISVPMVFYPGTSNEYTLSFDDLASFPASVIIYLEDKKTGVWTNLRMQNFYTFTSTTTDNIQRFNIHFEPPVSITKENAVCSNEGFISISNPSHENWTYVLTKNGLELTTGTLTSEETLIESLTSGVYTLKLNTGNYSVEEELVIQADGSLQSFIAAMEESYYINDQIEARVYSPNEGTEYRWFINDLFAGVGLALNVTITDPGSYQLRLEANKGICNSTSYYDFFVDAPLTISNIMQNYGLRAYPNPANELVNLVWNDDIQQVNQVIIYDISGREIRRQNVLQQVKGNQLSLDVSDLKVGIYLITIEGKDIRKTVNVSVVH